MQQIRNIRGVLIGITVVAVWMSLLAPITYAQASTEITAVVDKTELAVGDILSLAVTITGPPNPRRLELPEYDTLELTGLPSTLRETSIVSGRIRSRIIYNYRFVAVKEGKETIGPLRVTISGQIYETEPIEITILRGLGGSSPTPNQLLPQQPDRPAPAQTGARMFVEAYVDIENPFLGEQITYTFRFYRRSAFPAFGRFGQPRYQAPDFGGFWNNQETEQDQFRETVGSLQYEVVELQTILFASVVGSITIEAAKLTVPGDGFESPTVLTADAITLDIRPLPPSAPPRFTGAVGKFQIAAQVDDTSGKVNEPVTLTVTVSGDGNIDSLPDPAWPAFEEWRVFESPAVSNTRVVDGRLTGNRTYESILVPEMSGPLAIPEIGYSYFNPEIGEYVEASTDPITISVAESDGSFPLPAVLSNGRGTVERTGSDIRHIKPAPPTLARAGTALTSSVAYLTAWGVPLLALAGAVVWQRRRTRLEGDGSSVRLRNAMFDARSALAVARQSDDDPRATINLMLLSYIGARLGVPVVGLTREALDVRLQDAGVQPDLAQRVQDTLTAGEMATYAPLGSDSGNGATHLDEAERLVADLEDTIIV